MSPGRKPSFSPASTAGRVRMMRRTSLRARACTADATARYVLPVPAGAIAETIGWGRLASTDPLLPPGFRPVHLVPGTVHAAQDNSEGREGPPFTLSVH